MPQSRLGTASALLNCLEQLHGDVWAEVLLPKLRADKSAGNLALTCSCLMDMCQKSQRHLDLSSISNSSSRSRSAALGALAQHFPNCTLVKIKLDQDGSYLSIPAVVNALASLSSLTGLNLSVLPAEPAVPAVQQSQSQSLALAMAVSTITRQLPQLSALSVHTTHNWPQVVWDELGTATQLTSLSIDCPSRSGSDKYSLQNVAALRGLTGLQHLVITQRRPVLQQHQQQQDDDDDDVNQPGLEVLLGSLSALTRLDVPVLTTRGLSSISSIGALEILLLRSARLDLQLAASDLAALGQLTQLTLLHISSWLQDPEPQQQAPFYAALGKLVCLAGVSAGFWTPAALPVLAALPKLEYIRGGWQDDGDDALGATCTTVTCLYGLHGAVPFAAFPNLGVAAYCGAMHAPSWLSLSSCPKLIAVISDLNLDPEQQPGWASFVPGTGAATRVAAIQSLSALTALTALTFYVSFAYELAAVVDAVPPQVQRLQIADCGMMRGGWSSWFLLGKLSHIRSLVLDVWDASVQDVEYFTLLLAAVSHVPKVTISLSPVNFVKCSAAARQNRDVGMKLPPGLTVKGGGRVVG